MVITHRQQREIFHFLFLKKLLKISDQRLFVLKGGVNLRFFFSSPRYSEDMDLDVLAGSVPTLRKNGYRILEDLAFRRSLQPFGIADIILSDPDKAKHTNTTQRFNLHLINIAGESYPTKVEFSRRTSEDDYILEPIHPKVARLSRSLSFPCQHYTPLSMVSQKLKALANRAHPQTRDVFDLYVLWLGGYLSLPCEISLSEAELLNATENIFSFSYEDYRGQVLEYLEPQQRDEFEGEVVWNLICEKVLTFLEFG
jgi:predicted nucleotidyltransferase component of viral defense system